MTEPHSTNGSGFSHLSDTLPITITLARGARRVTLSAHSLEAALAAPGLAVRLAALLARAGRGPSASEAVDKSVGGKGGVYQENLSQNANAVENSLEALAFRGEGILPRSSDSVRARDAVDNPRDDQERFAQHLASSLGGRDAERNIPFYRLVARAVPRSVALDALVRAKDARDIRKSRAHLFASLVRPHLPHRSLKNP